MTVFHLDFETFFDEKAGISLSKMALRKYLEVAPVIGFSVAIDHSAPTWIPADSEDFLPALTEIEEALQQPGNILNAYNVPFDARVMCFGRLEAHGEPFGCRWPIQIRDTMEMSMAAWSNQPGGYSLRNVAAWLGLPPKLSMSDVFKKLCTWEAYCNRDTELLQAIYYRALSRLPEDELYYSENCNRVRGIAYSIREDTVKASLDAFTKNTEAGVAAAVSFLSGYARDGEDLGGSIFGGYTEGKVRSVKAKALKELLIGALGFDTTSTSLKKINPVHLAGRPDVNTLLQATSKANKGLYYQKRATALLGSTEIDMEKGYFRATNTGRTSAPTTGRGVNTANLSKKDKTIAKPLRQMLALPDDMCYVRADAANVEYRIEGLLTGSDYVTRLFSGDINADPYSAFAKSAFGVTCKKGEPMRDVVAKAAVLGYGFCLAEGTPILTKIGWKPIETITEKDELWDGTAWILSRGAVLTGTKPVIQVGGIALTPDHKILCQTGWHPAGEIVSSGGTLRPLLAPNSGDGRLWEKNATSEPNAGWSVNASAELSPLSESTSSGAASAMNAPAARVPEPGGKAVALAAFAISSPILACEAAGRRLGVISGSGASTLPIRITPVTGAGASRSLSRQSESSSPTSSLSPGGTAGNWNSTAPITPGGTSQGTSAWSLPWKTVSTEIAVWDIVDAGPRHRFQAGPLIVHNCMGTIRAIEELNRAVADPINKVSVAQIEALCNERGWKPPSSRYLKGATTRVGCHWSVAVAANESREAFHGLHPEFGATADWLQRSVEMLAASKDPERIIDRLYEMSGAPNRDLLELCIDKELEFPTVRVRLFGHSMPTVTWRHLSCSHPGIDGLGAVTANKGPRNVHRALLIENCVQSAARLGLLRCENELARRGWITDSVYDEILILCKRDRETVLRARADLVDVMSPTGPHGMGWAFYGKPGDMTVTKTRYEDEAEAAITWKKLEANDPTWTEHLT